MSSIERDLVIFLPILSSQSWRVPRLHNPQSHPERYQLIFSVFKTLTDQRVTVELKNDLSITGTLKSVDQSVLPTHHLYVY